MLLAGLICACTRKDDRLALLPDMSAVRANLAFTCVHESDHLPPLDPEADELFQNGLSEIERKMAKIGHVAIH